MKSKFILILILCFVISLMAQAQQFDHNLKSGQDKEVIDSKRFFEFGHLLLFDHLDHFKGHFATNIPYSVEQQVDYSQLNFNLGYYGEFAQKKRYSLFLKFNYSYIDELNIKVRYNMHSWSGSYQHIYHYNIKRFSSIQPSLHLRIYPENRKLFHLFCSIGAKFSFALENTLTHINTDHGSNIDTRREELKDVQHLLFSFGFGYKYKSLNLDFSYTPLLFNLEQHQDSYYAQTGTIFSTKFNAVILSLSYAMRQRF
jgi:hypothetical protein